MSSLSGEDDTHVSKEDTTDDNNPEKPLKGGKPRGPEHEHFTHVEMINNRPKLKCKYCSQEIMRHAERMRSHLATKCTEAPADVRKKFEATVKARSDCKTSRSHSQVDSSSGNGSSTKRTKLIDLNLSDLTCSSVDEDEDDDDLTSPMKVLNTVFKSLSRAGNTDGSSSSKKSMKQMSDAEVDRELKEMQVKKIRTQIQMMEEQMQLYNSLGYKLGKLLRTMDEFFKAKSNEPKELRLVD